MNKKIINKLLKHKMFLLIPTQDKIKIINHSNINLNIKAKLLKSLEDTDKNQIFSNIYKYQNNFTTYERITFYKLLSYKDKVFAYNFLNQENKIKYLEYFTHKELWKAIINRDLDIQGRVYITDNILTNEQKLQIYKHHPLYSAEEIIATIKNFEEEYRRKIIKNKHGQIKELNEADYIKTLVCLPTVEEKMEYLNDNNKYNVKLNFDQKLKLIITTNDQEKINFITTYTMEPYKTFVIANSLTDEGKLKFITDKDKLNHYLRFYTDEFYSNFSETLARKAIKKIQEHNSDTFYIEYLINRLPPEERIEYVFKQTGERIYLSYSQKSTILYNLQEEYKIELLKINNIYNIRLTESDAMIIAEKIKLKNLIKTIVATPEKYYKFEPDAIWKIIESHPSNEVISLYNENSEEIKNFIDRYTVSLVKCLCDEDRVDIIYNRSKYGIYLEDNKKIKILKSLCANYDESLYDENIFKYFDEPNKVIDQLINNKQIFKSLNLTIKKQLIEFYRGKEETPEFIHICSNIIQYTNNPKEILENFEKFKLIFDKLNINLLDFIQYGINNNKYAWNEMVLNIITNNKFEEFYQIKNYFFNNYYVQYKHKKNNIENFLDILNAYTNYETLCKNLASKNKILTELDKLEIKYLFNSNQDIKPENIEDIKKIRNDKIKQYHDIAKRSNNIYGIKLMLLQLFFNKDIHMLKDILSKTGGVQELNILKFNNKDNPEYAKSIDHLILMTEFIENILITEDLVGLQEVLIKYTSEDHFEETRKYIDYFSKYEEFIRKIYELDVQISLTNIETLDDSFTKTDKAIALSKQYGGKVIDLSESQYVLIGHVKSRRESIDNLLSGTSDGNSNFICTSPVSHRGQHYYAYHEYSTVFAYDTIPQNSFICSSIDNLGSNQNLNYNTSEVPEFRRTQKGILETSEAKTHRNAEMLLYREGMKPCGIIIPTDESVSKEAIEYHQKYNLPFIITQGIDTTIENPKKITNQTKKINTNEFNNIEVPTDLINDNKNERKIAILTDPHALYEPTMACLTDIKNRGITEIYSLGDNIGHGPSPKETLDLLKQHNVKSILGNHELYVTEENSMEIFKEHLEATNALERTTEMTNWTKEELTKEQLQELKEYKDKYELITPNGKKITLIHTTEPYNKKGKYSNPIIINDSDMIIQGHIHFESQQNNNYTLRAVGIGQIEKDDGKASYAILTIKEDSCNLKIQNIPYNRSNLLHTINESTMPVKTKKLIEKWVGNHII